MCQLRLFRQRLTSANPGKHHRNRGFANTISVYDRQLQTLSDALGYYVSRLNLLNDSFDQPDTANPSQYDAGL
jgi:hypothetical protein